jgi:hypothetical protein
VLASVRGEEVCPVPVDVIENLIHPGLEAGLCSHFGMHIMMDDVPVENVLAVYQEACSYQPQRRKASP